MTSAKLRVGYIPEHFSSPLLILSRTAWGKENLDLVPQPAGTGQVLTSFSSSSEKGQEIDVAIALTEALIAGIAKGRDDIRLVGSYVRSSLVWAVSTGTSEQASKYNSISDLKGSTIGISRIGSGSQIMASVMALQNGWVDSNTGKPSNLEFQIDNTFRQLRNSVNDGSTAAFMWETFTTKPYYDNGEVRKIGEVPTPWPSWTIAASRSTALASAESRQKLDTFLSKLQESILDFLSPSNLSSGSSLQFISDEFNYPAKDVSDWFQTVRWVGDARPPSASHPATQLTIGQETSTQTISRKVLLETVQLLEKAGVLEEEQVDRLKKEMDLLVDAWGNGAQGRLVE